MATQHNYNSWGRTRSPKNLAGSQGGEVTTVAETALVDVTAAANSDVGFFTENQRYLHVLLEDGISAAPQDISVFGYCHAFLRWFEIPETETGGEGQNTANAASSIACADSGRAPAAQVPSDREYRRYDIAGIDRVAFVHSDPTEVEVFAACSTF